MAELGVSEVARVLDAYAKQRDAAGREAFRFPGLFVFGRTLEWDHVFPSAVQLFEGKAFEELSAPLLMTAVDLQCCDGFVRSPARYLRHSGNGARAETKLP